MDSLHEPATATSSAEPPVEAAQAESSNLDQQRPSFSSPDRYHSKHPLPANNTKASMISSLSPPPVAQSTTTASVDALPWEHQHQQEAPVSSSPPPKTNGSSNNSNGVLPLPPGAAPSVVNRYSDPHMMPEIDGGSRRRQQQQGSSSEQAQGSSQQQQQPQPLPTRPQRSTSAPLLSGDELAKPRTSGSRSSSSRRPSPSPVRPPYDRESSSNSTPRAGGAPPPPIDPRIELDPHIPAMPSQMLAHGPRHPSLPHAQLQQQLNSTSSSPINGKNINAMHHSILAASSPSSSPYPAFPPLYDVACQPQHHQQQSSSATATGAGGVIGSSNSPSPYAIPLSPTPRASAQFPTYVVSPGPMASSYVPQQPQQQPQEEVCVECAMRDQDMADVDVTSPGVWDRESDIHYRELVRLDAEEDARGIPHDPQRPRLRGNKLIEPNLRLWLSMNPREPQARAQTVDKYVRSQLLLLEAEAVARARAMQESRELDNRMRDAYSQLRRSAYETGSIATPIDDLGGGVRLRNPSGSGPGPYGATAATGGAGVHGRNASRDVTLLENGMIVEHVDVRKEERQRRRQERNAARKSPRASASGDVLSLVSTNNSVSGGLGSPLPTPMEQYGTPTSGGSMPPLPHTPLSPHPGFAGGAMMRPASGPPDLHLPRAVSQASFSDVQSVMSASPRRSRFFGMRNLSMVSGWKSQDSLAPSGISGSMVDMHVVLQRDSRRTTSPSDQRPRAKSLLNNLAWSPFDNASAPSSSLPAPFEASTVGLVTLKPKKKRGGIAKIWRIVTGSNNKDASSQQQQQQPQMQEHRQASIVHPNSVAVASPSADDDLPLAPPPPLSYLVDRSGSSNQHQHSPGATGGMGVGSPPSVSSPRPSAGAQTFSSSAASLNGRVSPPTAPSSLLPSPTSSRVIDRDSGLVIMDSGSSSGGGSGVGRKQSVGNTDILGEVERLDVLAEEKSSFNGSITGGGAGGGKRSGVPMAVHTMTSEPDMRMRTTSSPSLAVNGGGADAPFQTGFVGNPYANGQMNGMVVPRQGIAMHIQTYQQQRPQSSLAVLMSRDKSLPPLPPGEGSSGGESSGTGTGPRPPLAQPEVRPRTVFTYGDHQAIPPGASPPRFEALMAAPAGSSAPFLLSSSNASAAMAMSPVDGGVVANDRHLFQLPRAPFSHQTPRRQSFSGISGSRPVAVGVGPGAAATMSGRGAANMSGGGPQEQRQFSIRSQQSQQQYAEAYGAPYDEFGDSRLSLAGYDPADAASSRRTLQQQQQHHQQPTKRKSKFAFASLLGRKSQSQDASDYRDEKAAAMQRNETMSMMSGNAYTLDTHSHTQSSAHPASQSQQQQGKMSLASRKAIESLVEQDAEFVAYRYPSADQPLMLMEKTE